MDQDTETTQKLLSTFKENTHGSLKNINNLTLKNYDINVNMLCAHYGMTGFLT